MASAPLFSDDLRLEKAKEELKSSAASISSTDTAHTLADNETKAVASSGFQPGRSLFINTRGHKVLRLPLPPKELEISTFHADGSLAYLSTRGKRSSGDAILSSPKLGQLVSTSYFFGPSRDPVIRLLDTPEDSETCVKVTGKWTSRKQAFTMPDGSKFEWSYIHSRNVDGKKERLLVLDKLDGAAHLGRRRVAQLVRNEQTRTPGTSSCTAGNGGELVLAQDAFEMLDEAMVVATCILMLKKEVDRLRLIQFMVIAGGGSGN